PPGWVLTVATGLGAPGGGCGMPPSAWCEDWVTALRCGALGSCPHLTQGNPNVDICAVCQQLFDFLRQASNQSTVEVVLDQVVGILCPHPPVVVTPCQALVRVLVDHLPWQIQHLLSGSRGTHAKPWQVCATLKLCRGEPGTAPAVTVLEAPGSHLQGSGGAGLSPKALPLPLCWLCRTLVARAE
ncbi:PSPB protein, partial [Pomatorhinus ruficollis]|nr:PSPB protein [Pomatorhinus ruficollis]